MSKKALKVKRRWVIDRIEKLNACQRIYPYEIGPNIPVGKYKIVLEEA